MPKREIIRGPMIPEHDQPFPPAVRIGNMVFSAAVGGWASGGLGLSSKAVTRVIEA